MNHVETIKNSRQSDLHRLLRALLLGNHQKSINVRARTAVTRTAVITIVQRAYDMRTAY